VLEPSLDNRVQEMYVMIYNGHVMGCSVLSQEGFGRVRKGKEKRYHPLQGHRRCILGLETEPIF
jgi:hypothetical protein